MANPICNCNKSMVMGWDLNTLQVRCLRNELFIIFFQSRLNEDEVLCINVKNQMQLYNLVCENGPLYKK